MAKTLHWATVFLVVITWTLGTFGDELPEGSTRDTGLLTHISVGLIILALAAIRIPWRVSHPSPRATPTELGRLLIEWTDPAFRIMHYAVYTLLVAVPALSIALQFARGHSLPIFGLLEIPSPWIADEAFSHDLKEAHEVLV